MKKKVAVGEHYKSNGEFNGYRKFIFGKMFYFGQSTPRREAEQQASDLIAQARQHWREQAICPRLLLLEQIINDSLVPLYGDDSIWIEFENPIPEDEAFELQVQQITSDTCVPTFTTKPFR